MKNKAAIIGGGVIGGGWAARFLLMGWDVSVFDPDPEAERKISEVLENAAHSLPMLYETKLPNKGVLTFETRVSKAVSKADWIQESVPERLDIKKSVYNEIQKHCRSNAVIGSSTSGFKPSELQQNATRPEQIVVTHPFNPVYLLPLVELVSTDQNSSDVVEKASKTLRELGMFPLSLKREIDAHIADRLLEAVWREALWLIKDDIATTEEIDNAIRYGFGLRWAQMGLFETYRIAGGEAGMRHFIEQFGPCLEWPWTKLMDVPELTDELIDKISQQSDEQSNALSIRELERLRDSNLVAMMRALKGQDSAAGALLNEHQNSIQPKPIIMGVEPMKTVERIIPLDWTDYNGHMNESRYGQVFSDAADGVLAAVGVDADYVAEGLSYFTVDINIQFLLETHAGQDIIVHSKVLLAEGKKLRVSHEMKSADGTLFATGEQLLIHVDLNTRRACEPRQDVLEAMSKLALAHAQFSKHEGKT